MTRDTAREIAIGLAYELSFTDKPVNELLDSRLDKDTFQSLSGEDALYADPPNAKQKEYIRRVVEGVSAHSAELDADIERYSIGWKFSRIPLVASAIMRVAMYETLYMPDIPPAAAIHSAIEIAKKYETPETVRFINGILGSFARNET